jgi:hypothetical protein
MIILKEANMDARFKADDNNKTILWDPYMGLLTTNGVEMSPATVLGHEADHAVQNVENPKQQQKDGIKNGSPYENKEEERVITGSEQETAKKHGEIKDGEVTRTNHNGTPYKTTGPTTNRNANEFDVYGTQKKEEQK